MTIEEMILAELEKELNQQLLNAAFAGHTIHIETGVNNLGLGPKCDTKRSWIKLTRVKHGV